MRLIEAPPPVFDPPPVSLLRWHQRFSSERIPVLPGVVGAVVYASRGEWVAARRSWEAQHGQTIPAWYAEASAEARAERGLDGFAEMLAYRPDPDEDPPADLSGEW